MIKHKLTRRQQAGLAELGIYLMIAGFLIVNIIQLWFEYQQTLSWIESLK